MSIAAVTLTGYVALEPKLWFTKQAHTPVVSLRVGMTPRRMDASTGEWKDGPSSFFTVNCWRKLALNASASLHKGDPVIIRGQLRMRSWNDNGKMRSTVEIEAESVGHDVAYGFSHFMKGVHPSLLGFADGSASAAALGELPGAGGNGSSGTLAEDGAWQGGPMPSDGPSLLVREPLDNPAEQGSTELASGSGPLDAGGSDDSAGIPDGEVASEGVPF
jgi:single-strand DNA-binding protein